MIFYNFIHYCITTDLGGRGSWRRRASTTRGTWPIRTTFRCCCKKESCREFLLCHQCLLFPLPIQSLRQTREKQEVEAAEEERRSRAARDRLDHMREMGVDLTKVSTRLEIHQKYYFFMLPVWSSELCVFGYMVYVSILIGGGRDCRAC